MKEPVIKPVAAEAAQGEQAKEAVSRRRMFGAGFVGVASMLAAACSGTDFASGTAMGSKRKKKDESGGADAADGEDGEDGGEGKGEGKGEDGGTDDNDPGVNPGENGIDDCAANSTTSIDPSGADIGDLQPRVRFYGRKNSALVALKFPGGEPIDNVILATPSGKLIAVHTITAADKDSGGNYRPIVMDNLWLQENKTDLTEIRIIIQTPSGKKAHSEPIAFFTSFDGKPVIDLSGQSVPAGMVGHQSVTQFSASHASGGSNFKEDKSAVYPTDPQYNGGDPAGRYLQTAQTNTVWKKEAGVRGTVTDIMGDVIDIDGQGIIEYQLFCTYDLSGSSYVRTILHIG